MSDPLQAEGARCPVDRKVCEGVDIIGDVHGCGATLIALLEKLGYRASRGVYRHPCRRAIFVGDLIDRGPRVRLALQIVRRMVEAGAAQVVVGNHEVHALRHCLHSPRGPVRRPDDPRAERVMQATLDQFAGHDQEWMDYLQWFIKLPLCLEYDNFRVAHACWDERLLRPFLARYPDGHFDDEFLMAALRPGTPQHRILDRTTRGTQLPLPEGRAIRSSDGFVRRSFRTHFWATRPETYGDVIFQPDSLPHGLEARTLSDAERSQLVYYGPRERALFIGHYWCEGVPALPTSNIACLDYSAVKYGRLVAYRFDGHCPLDADRFVWVQVTADEQARKKIAKN